MPIVSFFGPELLLPPPAVLLAPPPPHAASTTLEAAAAASRDDTRRLAPRRTRIMFLLRGSWGERGLWVLQAARLGRRVRVHRTGDEADDLLDRRLPDVTGGDASAQPHDRHPVGDGGELLHVVADDDDADVVPLEAEDQ